MTDAPTTLIILGASGDLTRRLLLPGLGTLLLADPERRVHLLGVARGAWDPHDWAGLVERSLLGGGASPDVAERLGRESRAVKLDATNPDDLRTLLDQIPDKDHAVLYFAVPPAVTASVCKLLTHEDIGGLRLALEKPFGADLNGAIALNALLRSIVDEDQIFRVDHFLGQSQVLNLLGLRFANRLFEPLWDDRHVESVEIIADETIALEDRAAYYDHAGALIDMHQSHLLLMLAIITMEEPSRVDARELRDTMALALRATRIRGDDPASASRRARYTAGIAAGQQIPSYVDEDGVDPSRGTETLAELDLEVANRRWSDTRFRLRSGKALGAHVTQIVIRFRPLRFLPPGLSGAPCNSLTIDLNCDRLTLRIATLGTQEHLVLVPADMTASLGPSALLPYGEVLAGILDGDPLLSVRGDVAEECWRICTPVLEAWRAGQVPLEEYPAGSSGPPSWQHRP